LNAARGVPANPLSDSIGSAAIAIWYLDQRERGVRALDAALVQVPLRTLPIEQRPYFTFAVYYAMAGRPDKARAMLAQFDDEMKDPQLKANAQPARHSVLAEIAIAERRPLDAVREIWASDSLPDGPVGDCARCNDRDLGRAFDLANVADSAIFYWERYLKEASVRGPGTDGGYLPGMLKRLGELYENKGNTAKAASYFSAFLDLWKNADPELQPKVQDVKRRLAAIQAGEKR
jgi:tetratricopeptide (TPR) repeat protein